MSTDTTELQKQIQKLQQEKSSLEAQLQQEKAKTTSKQQDAISLLQSKGEREIRPTTNLENDFVNQNKQFASYASTRVDPKTRIEALPYKGFCHKMGVKLVYDTEYEKQVEAGGGDELYGVCINVDEYLKVAHVVRTVCQGHFVCANGSIKAGDKLTFSDKGILEKAVKNRHTYAHATAVKDSFEFSDKKGIYGVEVDFNGFVAPKVN
ncbi:hypothetical protein DB313_05730 (plasmid) [Borrelia turcica IST7]|uniref:DUF228 domain-containing protein n=1 Tax=Borrelia turcica IST7 TaxID=1104446 RepID=A0A386PQ39_9SPIR|nr:DUF228 domain-containing protein [Borrelia turcica]AYE36999.1 hypothetical protein DB313_05730 [Borrelia turcica IST7]